MSGIFDLFKKIEAEREEKARRPISYLVAGLGNPGEKYELTRHNAGFLCADYLYARFGGERWKLRFKALCSECETGEGRILLLKPQTFMNASGEAIAEAMRFYKLPPEKLIVICDDVNFPCGAMRIRPNGSDAGQRGVRSTILALGSDAFPRIRLGVGEKPDPAYDLADWVLSRFGEEEKKAIYSCFEDSAEAIRLIQKGEIETAMSRCNRKGSR